MGFWHGFKDRGVLYHVIEDIMVLRTYNEAAVHMNVYLDDGMEKRKMVGRKAVRIKGDDFNTFFGSTASLDANIYAALYNYIMQLPQYEGATRERQE